MMALSKKLNFVLDISLILINIICCSGNGYDISYDGRSLKINGQRKIFLSGSIHYPRSTTQMWPELIKKAKEGGLDTIETYVFWNSHEPVRRQYDFNGNNNLIKFIKTIQNAGLFAVLRIGPYACAEWNYGGFPVWLHNMPGIEFRTDNTIFQNEMQNFTTLIVEMCKKEKLFASQGGPIILAQIENEYGNIMGPYGEGGKEYVKWCASMAESLNIGVPWIMCQQNDAPYPIINTCNGWYCDDFTPNNPNSPKMWTENWTRWFKNWGGLDPYRTAEDLAYAVARFFQTGGSFQNYYMYHGGTNFGRSAGGPYITTTYDYDAPLDEYGNPNEPKYGHLKQLHAALKSMEKALVYGDVNTTTLPNSVYITVYTLNGTRKSCIFGNANETIDAIVNYGGNNYSVPAWSVSILPDCKKEVYNTGKVNVQTTVMVKNPATNTAGIGQNMTYSPLLNWVWMPEDIDSTLIRGQGDVTANRILDQKFSNDTSGVVGSSWKDHGSTNSIFEEQIRLVPGDNQISLLSVTVGLTNYGSFFDLVPAGVTAPVEIVGRVGDNTIVKDISYNVWTYKVGLKGIDEEKFYNNSSLWQSPTSDQLPLNRMMTWYKATFRAPAGKDPVVVDLLGMGKGMAWVNGNSIGRYWPSFLASEEGCPDGPCDYRGRYTNNKCVWNCGQPTQRWYHIPRSFLNASGGDNNQLVLFEEFGGNPLKVNIRTVVPGIVRVNAQENSRVVISCQGRRISSVNFASFGDVRGSCRSKIDAVTVVEKACLGKKSCRISSSEKFFGSNNCSVIGVPKKLVVEATCS